MNTQSPIYQVSRVSRVYPLAVRLRCWTALALCAATLAPNLAWGTSCRELVGGIPFALPSLVLPSLADDRIYTPQVSTPSKVPGYLDKYFRGGKRLRPLMVYLSALAHGRKPWQVQNLAGLVELIHLGSLSLDDIIDDAKTRRGQIPLYLAEGMVAGLITGPWLQAYVFRRGPHVTNQRTMDRLADVLMEMGDGEILQDELKGRADYVGTYSQREYMSVALGKTGHLFGLSLSMQALHFEEPREVVELWTSLGRDLGVSYQMKDDFEDALTETGEINFAHLLRSQRFGGSPFTAMPPEQMQALVADQQALFQDLNQKMHSTLNSLRSVVPRPLTEQQQAAFATLSDMVNYVSTVKP